MAPERYEHSQGRYVGLTYFRIVKGEEQQTTAIVLVATDLTEQKKAEAEVLQERQTTARVVQVTKNKSRFIEFRNEALSLLNESKGQLATQNPDWEALKLYYHTL